MLGFRNMGNTCYLNSILSILLNCPNFISIIKTLKNKKDDTTRVQSATKLLDSFKELVELKNQVEENRIGVIKPGGIISLMFSYLSHRKISPLIPHRQNDALECLGVLLDAFEEGSSKTIDSNWKSGRVKRDIIRKRDMKTVDTKKETQITWNLLIPTMKDKTEITLQDCLSHTFDASREIVTYKRDEDTEVQDYIIQRKIESTPKLWFISFARWDMMQNKITSGINIPKQFSVEGGKKYALRGAVCHMGHTIPSGHYYSIVVTGDKVYRIDDDSIMPCPFPLPPPVKSHLYGVMYEEV